jgi:hypothetical protein
MASRKSEKRADAQENGAEGGFERASRHSPEKLSEWASLGGETVLAKYGPDYFVDLRKRRKHYPKYKEEAPAVPRTPRLPGGPINGQLGGWARGQKYSSEHRKHWVRQGGIATRTRYGSAFYRKIRKLRKDYPKGYETRKTVERRRLEAAHHAKLNQTAR